ncbi:restriction endonuclease subunit S [Streptococcus sp. V728]|uniref:restriction endonuclease subunit S n=1 Tax=Streptococcus sp. V728 TaxID=3455700 RepID=UPI003F8E1B70
MMKSQRKNIPLARVKGFEGTWELCTLGEHIEDYVEKTTVQNQYPVLTSSQNKGIVRQEDYFANRQVTTDSNIGYFVLPKGFFTYRSRSDNGVFKFNRNDLLDKGIISYFYPVFSIVEGDSDFYLRLLNTSITKQVMLQAEGTGQKVLSLSKFKSIKTLVPSLPEQSAIGSLFRTLDDLLASYKENHANYQSLKATMLSKIFPKAGQTVPEIRLAGFEGDWELIKLGEVCDLITKGTTAKSQSEKGKVNFVKVENLKENEIYPVVKISEEEHLGSLKRSILFEGDILFSIAGTLGRTAIVRNNILPANTNQALAIIRGYKLDTYFLLVVLSGEVVKDYIRKNPTVGAQPNLSLEQVSSLKIQVPSIEEQQAIGSYFSNLNNLISSHQEKISQLETLKKKLLQDMFV